MFAKYTFALIYLITIVCAQIDGEFWWLNKKLDKYREAPPQPQFENISELENDETDKIVFREDNDVRDCCYDKPKIAIVFQDKSKIVWPDNIKQDVKPESYLLTKSIQKERTNVTANKWETKSNEDVLEFKFPDDDNFIWKDDLTTESPKLLVSNIKKSKFSNNGLNRLTLIHDQKPIKIYEQEFENICTFVKKADCNEEGAIVYNNARNVKRPYESGLVCCILPISHGKLYFPDDLLKKRIKRSETQTNSALKQREALLLRKYGSQFQTQKPKLKPALKNKNQKIVSAGNEEYVDPYMNIKNSNFKKPINKYDYDSVEDDYVEDYIVEFPSPGLTGLYSDHSTKPSVWSFGNGNQGSNYGGGADDAVENGGTSFGYGANIDPRLEDRLSTASNRPPIRGRPSQITSTSTEQYRAESHTISYQSHPDFQPLIGYKLLNLVGNESRVYKKKITQSMTGESKETVLTTSLETDYSRGSDEDFDVDYLGYRECGSAVEDYHEDRQTGDAARGSHPWLALVMLTRRRQSLLCYATIVHTKAAVTAANCMHGKTSPGEVTLVAGVWDLSDEIHEGWQKRMASVHLHQSYRPGDFAHDLAILYWKRPLRLGNSVQPACLADPHVGDDCMFFGWGGFDQGTVIKERSKWQRASIVSPRACSKRLSMRTVPKNAFCATVHSRGSVSGIGGPLLCAMDGKRGTVGVALLLDSAGAVVLIPAREWTQRTLAALRLR